MELYASKVRATARFLRKRGFSGEFGLVLGSGLDGVVGAMEVTARIPYKDIPDYPCSTAPGHVGELVCGRIEEVPVVCLRGRKHAYEALHEPGGMSQVVFPVHVLAELGVPRYFATNAAGGLDLDYRKGDLMIIKGHRNHIPDPLIGPHLCLKRIGGSPTPRFTPMKDAYDLGLQRILACAGAEAGATMREGVYVAITGPSFETEPEVLDLRRQGDAVGMSTAPEVIVARNRGMDVVAFSIITNTTAPDGANDAEEGEVLDVLNDPLLKGRVTDTVRNFFRIWRTRDA